MKYILFLLVLTTTLFAFDDEATSLYFPHTGTVYSFSDYGNSYWAGTDDGLVELDSTFTPIRHIADIPGVGYSNPRISQLENDNRGTLWANISGRLYRYHGSSWEPVMENDTIVGISKIYTFPDGTTLLTKYMDGKRQVCRYESGEMKPLYNPVSGDALCADFILQDSEGAFIYIEKRSNTIVRGDQQYTLPMDLTTIGAGLDLNDDLILRRFIESTGGMGPGIFAFHRYNWQEEVIDSVLYGIETHRLPGTTAAGFWSNGQRAYLEYLDTIYTIENGAVVDTFSFAIHAPSDPVLFHTATGEIFLNAVSGERSGRETDVEKTGFYRYNKGERLYINTKMNPLPYSVKKLEFDAQNQLIMEGIEHYDTITCLLTDSDTIVLDSLLQLQSPFLYCMVKNEKQELLVIAESESKELSVVRFDGSEAVTTPELKNPLPTALSRDGTLWAYRSDTSVQSSGTLICEKNGQWTELNTSNGYPVPTDVIDHILVQGDSLIWLEGEKSVNVYCLNSNSKTIDTLDGAIPYNTAMDLHRSCMALDSNGVVWLISSTSVVEQYRDGVLLAEDTLDRDQFDYIYDIGISPEGHTVLSDLNNCYYLEDGTWKRAGAGKGGFAFDQDGNVHFIYDYRLLRTFSLPGSGAVPVVGNPATAKTGLSLHSTGKKIALKVIPRLSGELTVSIYQCNGRRVLQRSFSATAGKQFTADIAISSLSPGNYIFAIEGAGISHSLMTSIK